MSLKKAEAYLEEKGFLDHVKAKMIPFEQVEEGSDMHQVEYALSKHLAGCYLLNSYKKVKKFL